MTQPEPKHTPKPWKAVKHYQAGWDVISETHGHVVGDCGVIYEADARLIAAAPELLEACHKLVAAMREYEWDVEGPKPPKHDKIMSLAEAAIAKASSDNKPDTSQ